MEVTNKTINGPDLLGHLVHTLRVNAALCSISSNLFSNPVESHKLNSEMFYLKGSYYEGYDSKEHQGVWMTLPLSYCYLE